MPLLELTLFKNVKSPEGESIETTTIDFINLFKKPKIHSSKEGSLLIGPYTLNSSLRRKNENVESVTMLVFDIDKAKGKSFDDIYDLVKDYEGLVHTSWSHTELQTKCRIFLFLKSPIPKEKFNIVRTNFLSHHKELADIIDPSCKEISRGYFAYSSPKERKSFACSKVLDGKQVDWQIYVKSIQFFQPSEFNYCSGESVDDEDLVFEGERYPNRLRLIGKLINQGLEKKEVYENVIHWNETKCVPPEDEKQVIKNIEGIWEKDKRSKASFQKTFQLPVLNNSVNRYKLLSWGDLKQKKELEWRVKKIFPNSGLASIFGPSQSGKSFLAIDMALHIALGDNWFGYRVNASEVIYCMLEGEYGLKNRVRAWEIANSKSCPSKFKAFLDPFRINNLKDVNDFAKILPKECVVIIDTLNRSAPDADENSSKDMGLIIDGMKTIQSRCEGLVICVHHTGKDVSKGLRGHSSLLASLDSAIQVERTLSTRSWSLAKSKEGEDDKTANFDLNVQDLGKDSDGDQISSCSVKWNKNFLIEKKEPGGKQQRSALILIKKLLTQSDIKDKSNAGADTSCIKVEDAISSFSETLTTQLKNKRRATAKRVIQGLIDNNFLGTGPCNSEDWIWIK